VKTVKYLGIFLGFCFVSAAPIQAVESGPLLELVNVERASVGMPPLQADEKLDVLAREWAGKSAENKSLSHRKDLSALMRTGGWRLLNENVYMGSGKVDAARVVRAWMNSAGHKRNLLNIAMTHAGFGSATNADGETYVVFNGALK
jgi:uncharacterized protein YkwD